MGVSELFERWPLLGIFAWYAVLIVAVSGIAFLFEHFPPLMWGIAGIVCTVVLGTMRSARSFLGGILISAGMIAIVILLLKIGSIAAQPMP